jgi:hypothetical protein
MSESEQVVSGWRPIETAPSGWVRVSMRDVDRKPPEWVAKRIVVESPDRRPALHRPKLRALWIARDDGLVCAPTHWLPLPPQENE